MPFRTEVGLGPGDIVFDVDPAAPPQKKGHSRPPSLCGPCLYCGQTAGCTEMLLSMEVGLGPGHIVLDGVTAPLPPKGAHQPHVSAHVYCGHMVAYLSKC